MFFVFLPTMSLSVGSALVAASATVVSNNATSKEVSRLANYIGIFACGVFFVSTCYTYTHIDKLPEWQQRCVKRCCELGISGLALSLFIAYQVHNARLAKIQVWADYRNAVRIVDEARQSLNLSQFHNYNH